MTEAQPATAPERHGTVLTAADQIGAYKVAELVTLAGDGSPVGWPITRSLDNRLRARL